ncbi:MAG: hypothetical protein RR147_00890 [Oscillospiraceae bacterium]
MEVCLVDFRGRSTALPVLLEWKFSYGSGLPCDAFEVCFIYEREMYAALSEAVRLRAVHEGATVFFGVVDEFEISVSENGSLVFVRGRGLAALLIDNEVEAAQYFSASLDMILERYVYPLGITQVKRNASPPPQSIVVDSGASAYKVLEDFLWFGCRALPRFGRDGTLLIGEEKGRRMAIGTGAAVLEQRFRKRRYGVISEAIVKNKALGATNCVKNVEFCQKGGSCRRVVNVPRRTRFDTMRSTGEYQIERSRENETMISISVPAIFAAFPGDVVEIYDSPLGVSGAYIVGKATCFASGDIAGTDIILTGREM